jgi:predicted RNA binding protein YcfA (HicA-like mRNA interferase family)
MPKLPPLTAQRVIALLEQEGFVVDRTRGSHRIYYHPGTHRRVVVPFHRRDLPKGTLLEILRRAGIDPDRLRSS